MFNQIKIPLLNLLNSIDIRRCKERLVLRNSLYTKALYNCHIKKNVKIENILKENKVLETGFKQLFSNVPNRLLFFVSAEADSIFSYGSNPSHREPSLKSK